MEGKGRLLTIEVDNRSLEEIKRGSCHINYRLTTYLRTFTEKSRVKTPDGEVTEVSEEISEVIEAERTGSVRELDLLPSEKLKLGNIDLYKNKTIDLYLLRLRVNSDVQEIVMSEAKGDIPTAKNSSKQ